MGSRKERGNWEITTDLLAVIQEEKEAKKTRIMQRAYLNWNNFQRYFDLLLKEGFIAKSNPQESYELTEKGRILLKRLREVKEMLAQKEAVKILIH